MTAMAKSSWEEGRLDRNVEWDDLDERYQEPYEMEARRQAEAFCDGDWLYASNEHAMGPALDPRTGEPDHPLAWEYLEPLERAGVLTPLREMGE